MKPRKAQNDQSKGLARWDWIKRYLSPALKYAGISSNQFDKLFLNNDQFLDDRSELSLWPTPLLSINGIIYTPTGSVPLAGNTNDGYFYIEWTMAVGNQVFEADGDPAVLYSWDGTWEFELPNGAPHYAFYTSEQANNFVAEIDQTALGLGPYAVIRLLIAARIDGVIQTFGISDGTIECAARGLRGVIINQGVTV